jgi:rhodanese-related sulfurtransferase
MKHSPRFLALVDEALRRVREVSVSEVKAMLDRGEPFQLVDVREESEWVRGHLPTARHLSRGILERDAETAIPDLDETIVLYCGGGYRSALSADSLRQMGYTNVVSMAGGWRDWCAAGLPVEGVEEAGKR